MLFGSTKVSECGLCKVEEYLILHTLYYITSCIIYISLFVLTVLLDLTSTNDGDIPPQPLHCHPPKRSTRLCVRSSSVVVISSQSSIAPPAPSHIHNPQSTSSYPVVAAMPWLNSFVNPRLCKLYMLSLDCNI